MPSPVSRSPIFARSLMASLAVHGVIAAVVLVWIAARFSPPSVEVSPGTVSGGFVKTGEPMPTIDDGATPIFPQSETATRARPSERADAPSNEIEMPPPLAGAMRLRASGGEASMAAVGMPAASVMSSGTPSVGPIVSALRARLAVAGDETGDVVQPSPASSNRPPRYPVEARRKRIEGTVNLRLHIATSGEVSQAELVQSSGSALLDQAALEAARAWRYTPASRDGHTVDTDAEVPVEFSLH